MRPELTAHAPALRELCRKHRVRSLHVFGSAASDDGGFDPSRSDADLLVEFLDSDLGPWLKRYFDFKAEAEAILGRPVDLMLTTAPNKPHVRASVEASKVPLYAAA